MSPVAEPAANIARFAGDMFADDVLADTNPTFKTLRDLGDVVWLEKHDLYAVARYDDLVRALRADDKLISGQGVSVNHSLNGDGAPTGTSIWAGVTVCICAPGCISPGWRWRPS